MNVLAIIEGWGKLYLPSLRNKKEAQRRLEICNGCDQLVELSKLMKTLVDSDISPYKCGKCGCPLSTKVFSNLKKCPLNKW